MLPHEFANKWRALAPNVTERAAYQEHWRDLCLLIGELTPSSDHSGDTYAFEKHVKKAGTGETGFADVFYRDHFIAEYKAPGKSLGKALQQALLYARELGNPPLLVVCDLLTLQIYTNFTGSSPRTLTLTLEDIARDAKISGDLSALNVLRALFNNPSRLDPRQLREKITETATGQIGKVALALTKRGIPETQAAHFLMRVVFAMYAKDVGLLEHDLLTKMLKRCKEHPERSRAYFQELFSAMRTGGEFWGGDVRHFNGGLFDDDYTPDLTSEDAERLLKAATLSWAEVEPAIIGTLFEKSLSSETRKKRGAHYTGVQDILKITEPVIMRPLRQEWESVKAQIETTTGKKSDKTAAVQLLRTFLDRLATVRILDPACGSGNFLVVALGQLLDLEHEVRSLGFELGAGPFDLPPRVHPSQLSGIEIEPFAYELASVSIWIAFFQWKSAHGGEWNTPVLQRLGSIQNSDALLTENRTQTTWPMADFIVGNPPFIGNTRMRKLLGTEYVDDLRAAYPTEVPQKADFVTYWLEKSRQALQHSTTHAGLIVTNSVRGGASARVLERIGESGQIYQAWPNLPWVQEGAAVRVSLLAFGRGGETDVRLGHLGGPLKNQPYTEQVEVIHADLTGGLNLRIAKKLKENAQRSFEGIKPAGKFDLPSATAKQWLDLPNPAGVSNRDVLRPYISGEDLTESRGKDRWVIDFNKMPLEEASTYQRPMTQVEDLVRPKRLKNRRPTIRDRWWIHGESRPGMRQAIAGMERYIATTIHAQHRFFVWLTPDVVPNNALTVIAADDDFTFGVLNSSLHVIWSDRLGTTLEDRPRYTATTTFATFPFPPQGTGAQGAVEQAARQLEAVRQYLKTQPNPGKKNKEKLGMTTIYNLLRTYRETGTERVEGLQPLSAAHAALDVAVAAAYGWEWPLGDQELLTRLLTLNLERFAQQPAKQTRAKTKKVAE